MISKPLVLIFASLVCFSSHWCCVQVYASVCAPSGIMGYLKSIVTAPSPTCEALNHAMFYTITYCHQLWVLGVLALCRFLSTQCVLLRNYLT